MTPYDPEATPNAPQNDDSATTAHAQNTKIETAAPDPENRMASDDDKGRKLPLTTKGALSRLQPFMKEDDGRSARIFWSTWAVVLGAFALAVAVDHWAVRIGLCVLLGAMFTRLFVIFHDVEHGAIFRRQPVKRFTMRAFAYLMMSPPKIWHEGHSWHHRETGIHDKMVGGEFPVWTTERYRDADWMNRLRYRIMRNPITIWGGYISGFMVSSCIWPMFTEAKQRWRAMFSLIAHAVATALLVYFFGWGAALAAFLGPAVIGGGIGIYMIYVQHNTPGMTYTLASKRDPLEACIRTTTFFRMSPVMNWVTANIGFHNVHHLSPRIPFYNLPAATAALPELREFLVETSWKWRDVRNAFRANLYDPARRRMVTYKMARQLATAKI